MTGEASQLPQASELPDAAVGSACEDDMTPSEALLRVIAVCAELEGKTLGPDDRAVLEDASRVAGRAIAPVKEESLVRLMEEATGSQVDEHTRTLVRDAVCEDPCLAGLSGIVDERLVFAVHGFLRGRAAAGGCSVWPVRVSEERASRLALDDSIIEHARKLHRVLVRVV